MRLVWLPRMLLNGGGSAAHPDRQRDQDVDRLLAPRAGSTKLIGRKS